MSVELERAREIRKASARAPWRPCSAKGGCICGLVWSIPDDAPVAQSWPTGAGDIEPSLELRVAEANAIALMGSTFEALLDVFEMATEHRDGVGDGRALDAALESAQNVMREHLAATKTAEQRGRPRVAHTCT